MFDFVAVDRPHHRGALGVVDAVEMLGEFARVVEVPTFKRQWQAGQIIEHTLEFLCLLPDVAVHFLATERNAQSRRSLHVHSSVTLLILHDLDKAGSKLRRSIREREQDETHDLQRLQLVVRHDVVRQPALASLFEGTRLRHLCCLSSLSEPQVLWPPRFDDTRHGTWLRIGHFSWWRDQLGFQVGGQDDGLGKLTQLHRFNPLARQMPDDSRRSPTTKRARKSRDCSKRAIAAFRRTHCGLNVVARLRRGFQYLLNREPTGSQVRTWPDSTLCFNSSAGRLTQNTVLRQTTQVGAIRRTTALRPAGAG